MDERDKDNNLEASQSKEHMVGVLLLFLLYHGMDWFLPDGCMDGWMDNGPSNATRVQYMSFGLLKIRGRS